MARQEQLRRDRLQAQLDDGLLGVPLDTAGDAKVDLELDHASAVLLGPCRKPALVHRLRAGGKIRARLALLLQKSHMDCLAAEKSFSLRALLLGAAVESRGVVSTIRG